MVREDIREMEWEDLENIREFQPEGWSDVAELFRYNLDTAFCLPLKLVREDRMVAVGNIIFNEDSAWLSQIIVHPTQRNKGLGKLITQALIDRIDPLTCNSVLLDATFLGYPVYKKMGFEFVSEYLHFTAPAVMLNPKTHSPCLKPYEEKYLEQIIMLDQMATGEKRKMKLMEEMARSILWVNGETVEAVYFPSLGKGPVIASNAHAGIELMKHRIDTEQSAMFPIENLDAASFLLENHWTETRRSRRMILGRKPAWIPSYIYNVISGGFG
jgi:GNAT superfamily N-acetyltransferase